MPPHVRLPRFSSTLVYRLQGSGGGNHTHAYTHASHEWASVSHMPLPLVGAEHTYTHTRLHCSRATTTAVSGTRARLTHTVPRHPTLHRNPSRVFYFVLIRIIFSLVSLLIHFFLALASCSLRTTLYTRQPRGYQSRSRAATRRKVTELISKRVTTAVKTRGCFRLLPCSTLLAVVSCWPVPVSLSWSSSIVAFEVSQPNKKTNFVVYIRPVVCAPRVRVCVMHTCSVAVCCTR